MAQFQVTQGTQTNLANDVVGTNVYPVSKLDVGAAGASSPLIGSALADGEGNPSPIRVGGMLMGWDGSNWYRINSANGASDTFGTANIGYVVNAENRLYDGANWVRQRGDTGGILNYGLHPNYWGTTVTSGTSTLGTVKPLVSGSAIFVTDIIISVGSASNVVLGMGGTSTPLIGTLSFAANGGMVSNLRTPGSVISGSALVYQQSANGPLSITVQGFVK